MSGRVLRLLALSAALALGGADGLRDVFVWLAPRLPFGLEGSVIYHRFWSDDRGRHLGDEVDFVISRRVWEHFVVHAKGAFFIDDGASPAGRNRFILEVSYSY